MTKEKNVVHPVTLIAACPYQVSVPLDLSHSAKRHRSDVAQKVSVLSPNLPSIHVVIQELKKEKRKKGQGLLQKV